MNLPEKFTKRMEELLGEEYPEFLQCYEKEKKQGLRVNTSKISVEEFLKLTPFHLTPVPWTKNGFFHSGEDMVTRHPHYYAGLYYVQEPSAMVPASRLPVEPGDKVLDLCAAPGGKATELGAKLNGGGGLRELSGSIQRDAAGRSGGGLSEQSNLQGILVANDISVSRARGLLKNLELFGIPNVFVTAETPEQLLKYFPEYFDKILVDAPCSGEGMFRKDPGLIKSWQERGPEYYTPIQEEILSCAVRMLKPGGALIYSTCTFAPEEDEGVLAKILDRYPELSLETCEGYEGFASGIWPEGYAGTAGLIMEDREKHRRFSFEKCIRIWPHRMEGEGHFTALLRKVEAGEHKTAHRGATVEESATIHDKTVTEGSAIIYDKMVSGVKNSGSKSGRIKNNVTKTNASKINVIPNNVTKTVLSQETEMFLKQLALPMLEQGSFYVNKEDCFWIPESFKLPKLRYLRTGLHLGTQKSNRFEPSQALAMALDKDSFPNVLDLPWQHPGILRYLKGETLDLPEAEACSPGWVLICCDSYPLGWGKCVNGSIRNKYHPGWRMQ